MTKNTEKNGNEHKIRITIQGRKVTLHFADHPNTEIVPRIKQALLGTYMASAK